MGPGFSAFPTRWSYFGVTALSNALQGHDRGTLAWPRQSNEQETEPDLHCINRDYLLRTRCRHTQHLRCNDRDWSYLESTCWVHPAHSLLPQDGLIEE